MSEESDYPHIDEHGLIHRTPEQALMRVIFGGPPNEQRFREDATTHPNPEARKRALAHLEELIAPNRGRRKPKVKIDRRLKSMIFKRDGFTCQFCGSQDMLEADHIIPEVWGGETNQENLWTLCTRCNKTKASFYVSTLIEGHRHNTNPRFQLHCAYA